MAALQVLTLLISPVVYKEVSSGCRRKGAGTCWALFPPYGILIYTLKCDPFLLLSELVNVVLCLFFFKRL